LKPLGFQQLFSFNLLGGFTMPRFPKPFYRKSRQTWYVQIRGKQYNLGKDQTVAFEKYHEMMSQPQPVEVDQQSVACICDLFLEWTHKNRSAATCSYHLD